MSKSISRLTILFGLVLFTTLSSTRAAVASAASLMTAEVRELDHLDVVPLAGNWPGRMAAKLIRLPESLMKQAGEIADALEGDSSAKATQVRLGPDSIDLLNDRRPYLETTSKQPIAPW